jgi:hypothetical protein
MTKTKSPNESPNESPNIDGKIKNVKTKEQSKMQVNKSKKKK